MIDFFYNGVLVAILLLWVLSTRKKGSLAFVARLKKYRRTIAIAAWAILLAYAALFAHYFSYSAEIHDIDDAVEAGVTSVETGVNPYVEDVIPRFAGKYSANINWTYGNYNYMPLDLLVYAACETGLGFLGTPLWFVTANLIFSGAAFYLLHRLLPVKWFSFVPFAGIVMLFYAFDNGSLTLLFIVASIFALERSKTAPQGLALFLMALAALTKIYAVLPLAALFLFVVQRSVTKRDWSTLSQSAAAAAIACIVALAIISPFGVNSVLESAVLFHADKTSREGTSAGGTVLGEIALDSPEFSLVSVALVAFALVVGLWLRNLNDRVLMVMAVFLIVAVKSSLAPLTVAGVFLGLRMRDETLSKKGS